MSETQAKVAPGFRYEVYVYDDEEYDEEDYGEEGYGNYDEAYEEETYNGADGSDEYVEEGEA